MAITNDVFTGPGGNANGSEDLAPVVQEIWTDILQEPRFEDGTLMNWATDLSEYMSEGGDIAHVPGIYTEEFAPKTQSTQGDEVDTEAVAATDTTLQVNTHKATICACKSNQIAGSLFEVISSQARKIAYFWKVQRLLPST